MSEKHVCILVVDDQPKVLRFIEIDLKFRGFEVVTTTSGEKALELVESENPDVMLLDILMPGMDGLEVLDRLRASSQLPVIAFSASPGHLIEALKHGASDFINKPFRPDDISVKIRRLLGN